jgi:hypothetical protein
MGSDDNATGEKHAGALEELEHPGFGRANGVRATPYQHRYQLLA